MNENDFDDSLNQVLVCTYGDDCANATKKRYGSATAIYDAIKSARNAKGLNRKLYVIRSSCQGWCDYAPVCSVLPEGRVLKDVKPAEASEFVEGILEGLASPRSGSTIWDFRKSREENLSLKRKNV
jgi:(2Fe-2S) ferredoxin